IACWSRAPSCSGPAHAPRGQVWCAIACGAWRISTRSACKPWTPYSASGARHTSSAPHIRMRRSPAMRNNLWLRTVATSVIGLVAFGVLLFVPAGTFAYWQGWLFILVFSISTQAIGIYLARRDPALLARRLQAGPMAEQRTSQRVISALAFGSFAGV